MSCLIKPKVVHFTLSVSRQSHFAFSGLCGNASDSLSCALNLVQHLTIQRVKKSYTRQLASPTWASSFLPVKWVYFCSLEGLKGMFHWVLVQRPRAGVTWGLILCLMGKLISEEENDSGRARIHWTTKKPVFAASLGLGPPERWPWRDTAQRWADLGLILLCLGFFRVSLLITEKLSPAIWFYKD